MGCQQLICKIKQKLSFKNKMPPQYYFSGLFKVLIFVRNERSFSVLYLFLLMEEKSQSSKQIKYEEQIVISSDQRPFRNEYEPQESQSYSRNSTIDDQWVCPSGRKLSQICTSQNCKEEKGMICGSIECNYCQHDNCDLKKLKFVMNGIRSLVQIQDNFMKKLDQKEEQMIGKLKSSRQSTEKTFLNYFSPQLQKLSDLIYFKKEDHTIPAHLRKELKDKLNVFNEKLKSNQNFERKIQQLTRSFEKQIEQLLIKLKVVRAKAIQSLASIFNNIQEVQQNESEEESVEKPASKKKLSRHSQNKTLAASKVLNPDKKNEEIKFIKECLLKIKQKELNEVTLIYRASNHLFRASSFHQACDNVSHTLTLIKTEFNKIIGGYTPLKWGSIKNNQYGFDKERKGFLVSLDMRKTMLLKNEEFAIKNSQEEGPIFGEDICIKDYCTSDHKSYANFPTDYRFVSGEGYSEQEVWTMFSGATKGNNFKVVDYEAYKVKW